MLSTRQAKAPAWTPLRTQSCTRQRFPTRWPALAAHPTDSGVESVVSYRLAPSSPAPAGSLAGSLNAYAGTPDAFDAEAQEIGLILAAHASVAAGAMREREALEEMSRHLHEASCRETSSARQRAF